MGQPHGPAHAGLTSLCRGAQEAVCSQLSAVGPQASRFCSSGTAWRHGLSTERRVDSGAYKSRTARSHWGDLACRSCLMNAMRDSATEYEATVAGVSGAGLQAMLMGMPTLQATSEAHSRLIHWEVTDAGCAEPHAIFASPRIRRDIMNQELQQATTTVEFSLSAQLGQRAYASLAGFRFEHRFHERLRAGATFKCRSLEEPLAAATDMDFAPVGMCIFQDSDQIRDLVENTYCVPQSVTFKAVDSLLSPAALFQVRCRSISGPAANERGRSCNPAVSALSGVSAAARLPPMAGTLICFRATRTAWLRHAQLVRSCLFKSATGKTGGVVSRRRARVTGQA